MFIVSASSLGPGESYSLTTIAKKASLKKTALLLALTIFMIVYVPHPVSAPTLPPVSCGGEPDFSLTAGAFELNIVPGSSNSTTLTMTSFYGFAGNVTLIVSASSTNITATPTPASVILTAGGSKTSTLDVSAMTGTPGGSYSVYVTASNGTLTKYTSVGVIVPKVPGPDFTLSFATLFSTIVAGSTGTDVISVTSLNGFAGMVNLTSIAYPPVATTLTPTSLTLISGETKNSTLVFPTNSSSLPGSYFVSVKGTSGSLTRYTYVFILVTGPNFELSAATSSLTIARGSSATVAINVTSLHSFSAPVSLLAMSDPSISLSLSPTVVTPAPDRGLTSDLTITTSPLTYVGEHPIEVAGISGALTNYTSLSVEVTPDFNMTASPQSLTIQPGGASASSTFTFTSIGGYAGPVAVSMFCPFVGLKAALSPGNVTLTSGGTATDALTVSADSNTPTGDYFIGVDGVNGTEFHSAGVFIHVASPDFTVSADPQHIVILPGSKISTITVASVLGYSASAVALNVTFHSPELAVTCSPTSVSVSSGVNGTSICTFSATVRGTYTAKITGTVGGLSHSVTVYVTITGLSPNFDISASPPTKGPLYPGAHGTGTITVTAVNGFTGTVGLTTTASTGLTATLSPPNVTGNATSTLDVTAPAAGTYTVTVTGKSGSLVHTTAVITVNVVDFNITASSPSPTAVGVYTASTISVTAVNGFAGTVTLAASPPAGLTCYSFTPASVTGSGTATLSCSSTTAGTYPVTITATSGSLTHSTTATFTFAVVPDFAVTASTPLSVNAGQSASSTITLTALNSFTGTVALADTPPAGLTCIAIAPSSLTLSPSPATATLSCSATAAGRYAVTVMGTGSSGSHSKTVTFNFMDFTISANPASVGPVITGASGTSTITVTAQNGFSGVVSLSANPSAGLTATLSTPSITGFGTSTLTLSATTTGTYTVKITGTSGGLHHTTESVTVTVTARPPPDYSISASQPSVSIQAGNTAASTITLTSLNGFTGTVYLSTIVSPSGPQASLIPTSVTIGTSVNSTLTIAVPSTVSAGPYAVTVTGTSGSLLHSTTVALTVTSASSVPPQQAASNILGLDPTLFYGLVGVLVVGVAGGIGVVVWKKRSSAASTGK